MIKNTFLLISLVKYGISPKLLDPKNGVDKYEHIENVRSNLIITIRYTLTVAIA